MELSTSPKALDAGIAAALGIDLSDVMKFRRKAAERGFADIRARGLAARKDRTSEAATLLPPLSLNQSESKRLEMLPIFPKLKPEFRQRLKDGAFDSDLPASEWGEPYVPVDVLSLSHDAPLNDHLEAILRSLAEGGTFYDCERKLGDGKRLRCEAVFSTGGIARIDFIVDEKGKRAKFEPIESSGIRFGDWASLDIVGLSRRNLPPAIYTTITTGSLIELANHLGGTAQAH